MEVAIAVVEARAERVAPTGQLGGPPAAHVVHGGKDVVRGGIDEKCLGEVVHDQATGERG
jgi:hypothetical protein